MECNVCYAEQQDTLWHTLDGCCHKLCNECIGIWTKKDIFICPLCNCKSNLKETNIDVVLPQMMEYIEDEVSCSIILSQKEINTEWKEDCYGFLNVSALNSEFEPISQAHSQPQINDTELKNIDIKLSRSIFPYNYKFKKPKGKWVRRRYKRQRCPTNYLENYTPDCSYIEFSQFYVSDDESREETDISASTLQCYSKDV